jgi:hypothetical protein
MGSLPHKIRGNASLTRSVICRAAAAGAEAAVPSHHITSLLPRRSPLILLHPGCHEQGPVVCVRLDFGIRHPVRVYGQVMYVHAHIYCCI